VHKIQEQLGLFWEHNGERKIKFRHVLFEELPKVDLDVSTPETASDGWLDIPEEFRLENWPWLPCLHDAGRAAIQEMIETHRVTIRVVLMMKIRG